MFDNTKRSCYKCSKRTIGCHSTCKEYMDDTIVNQKKQEAIKQQRKDVSERIYRLRSAGGFKWHK